MFGSESIWLPPYVSECSLLHLERPTVMNTRTHTHSHAITDTHCASTYTDGEIFDSDTNNNSSDDAIDNDHGNINAYVILDRVSQCCSYHIESGNVRVQKLAGFPYSTY